MQSCSRACAQIAAINHRRPPFFGAALGAPVAAPFGRTPGLGDAVFPASTAARALAIAALPDGVEALDRGAGAALEATGNVGTLASKVVVAIIGSATGSGITRLMSPTMAVGSAVIMPADAESALKPLGSNRSVCTGAESLFASSGPPKS